MYFRRTLVVSPEVDDHKTHDVEKSGEYEDLNKIVNDGRQK